jgi:hypothetical protein
MPASAAEIESLSWSEMEFILAISHAQAIQAFVDKGEEALRSDLERWEPEARTTVARALAEVATLTGPDDHDGVRGPSTPATQAVP